MAVRDGGVWKSSGNEEDQPFLHTRTDEQVKLRYQDKRMDRTIMMVVNMDKLVPDKLLES